MKYLKTYESHVSPIESEIRDILSDITDDDDFTISIKSSFAGRDRSVIDEDDFTVKIYEREDRYFSWKEVKDSVQMLVDNLKDRYPIIGVEAACKTSYNNIQLNIENGQVIFHPYPENEVVIKRITCMFIK